MLTKAVGVGLLWMLLALPGCKDKAASEADKAALNEAATQVNKAIPAELAGKLEFVVQQGGGAAFLRPEGWSGGPLSYRPGLDGLGGVMSHYVVSHNCDGTCENKDWAEVVERVDLNIIRQMKLVVKKDEKGEGRRLVVARSDDEVEIVAAWWKKDSSRYFHCQASLAKELVAAADAFEQACLATKIISW